MVDIGNGLAIDAVYGINGIQYSAKHVFRGRCRASIATTG